MRDVALVHKARLRTVRGFSPGIDPVSRGGFGQCRAHGSARLVIAAGHAPTAARAHLRLPREPLHYLLVT
jgi:hypothetical protein